MPTETVIPNNPGFKVPSAPDHTKEIRRAMVGSVLHGLADQVTEDYDYMGVTVPDPEYVVGLQAFEHFTWRSQPEGAKSGPGDVDLSIYSLQKYARLAIRGNPTVIQLLFTPDEFINIDTRWGKDMARLWPGWVASKRAITRFLGYMTAQKQRLLSERGGRTPNRPDLWEKYGYDTKYCAHMVRLGYQGIEYANTARITLPMPEDERTTCFDIRHGKWTENQVLTLVGDLAHELEVLKDTSPLPDQPNQWALDQWLVDTHLDVWKSRK